MDVPHFLRWIRIYDMSENLGGLADDETRAEHLEAASGRLLCIMPPLWVP